MKSNIRVLVQVLLDIACPTLPCCTNLEHQEEL